MKDEINDLNGNYAGVYCRGGNGEPYRIKCIMLFAGHYSITTNPKDTRNVCEQLNSYPNTYAISEGNRVFFDPTRTGEIQFTVQHSPSKFIGELREQAVENRGCNRIFEIVKNNSLLAGTYWISLCDEDEIYLTSVALSHIDVDTERIGYDLKFELYEDGLPVAIYTSINNVDKVKRQLESRVVKITNNINKKLKQLPIIKQFLALCNKDEELDNEAEDVQSEDDSFKF